MLAVALAGVLAMAFGKPGSVVTQGQQDSGMSPMGGQGNPDQDIALLRQDLRAKKQQLIGRNLSLSDQEAEKFWPVYNHYTEELRQINDEKFGLIKSYGEMWGTITDQEALIYIRRWLEVDGKVQALRLKYVPIVSQVLPGKKAPTFFQLDRRISMLIDVQLSSQLPLVHGKEGAPQVDGVAPAN